MGGGGGGGGRGRGPTTVQERAARLPDGTNLKAVSLRQEQIWLGYDQGFHKDFEIKKFLGKGAFASVYLASVRESAVEKLKDSLERTDSFPVLRRILTRRRSSKRCPSSASVADGGAGGGKSPRPPKGADPSARGALRGDLAVKVIEKASLRNLQEALWLRQEADTMNRLGGSLNAVTLVRCYESKNHVYLVMELCSGGNLLQKLSAEGALGEEFAALLVGDILRMAYQCHCKGVIHRDIKPENFLFTTRLPGAPLKMTDFGLADYCDEHGVLTEISGTPYYIAPEVIRQKYGLPADLWSCGAVMYKILTGSSPFSYPNDKLEKVPYKAVFRRILNNKVSFEGPEWDRISSEAKDLCGKLLQKDPKKRPTAAEALEHPWLREGSDGKASAALEDSLVQRMQLYASYNVLKQKTLFNIARDVAPDDLQDLQELWDAMNVQGIDGMDTLRMLDGLELAGYTVGEKEGSNLLRSIIGKDETLTFEQFATSVLDWKAISTSAALWEDALKQEFRLLDADRDGTLSLEDLLQTVGGAEPALRAALAEGCGDRYGRISLEEFLKMMRETAAAEGFDKRLSSRYRNSFPRRTNSFLDNLSESGGDAASLSFGNLTAAGSTASDGSTSKRRPPHSPGPGAPQQGEARLEGEGREEKGLPREVLDAF